MFGGAYLVQDRDCREGRTRLLQFHLAAMRLPIFLYTLNRLYEPQLHLNASKSDKRYIRLSM